jgi:hypothetical protein
MRALVTGWFSFEHMGATAGDFLARDVVCDWLGRAGCAFDIALAPPFAGGVDWSKADPRAYTHLVFVCGPFGRSWEITQFLERFSGCKLVGVNLSMLEPLEVWNPFHLLFERDSSLTARPDLSLISPLVKVPVVGVVLIDSQPEYGNNDVRNEANAAIERLIARKECAVVRIDTRLDINQTGLRTASEIESLLGRMDLVLTTRMHGLVLSIKNGVPVVAVDPVAGGAKVKRQADTLGWPTVFTLDSLSDAALDTAYAHCLTEEARAEVSACRARAKIFLQQLGDEFVARFA